MQSSRLKSLTLDRNELGPSGGTALGVALHHQVSLQRISLVYTRLGDAGVVALADALKHNTALRSINLKWNELTVACAGSLADALVENSSLQELNLCSNNEIAIDGVRTILCAVKRNPSLRSLDLSGVFFGDSGAQAVADVLINNTSLLKINLNANRLSSSGATAIASALIVNSSLQFLCVGAADEDGAGELARALPQNRTLQCLELSADGMGKKGVDEATASLISSNSLRALSLRGVLKPPESTCAMAESLARNSKIQHLDLSMTNLGSKQIDAIASALQSNKSLQSLRVHGDRGRLPDSNMWESFAKSIQTNTTVTHLDISESPIYSPKAAVAHDKTFIGLERNRCGQSQALAAVLDRDFCALQACTPDEICRVRHGSSLASLLHTAARHNDYEMVLVLAAMGLDPTSLDKKKNTPRDYAIDWDAYDSATNVGPLCLLVSMRADPRSWFGLLPEDIVQYLACYFVRQNVKRAWVAIKNNG